MRDGTKEVSELYDAREQMRNTVKELREQLAAAHARIAELERCVVMGGDGKPIAVGQIRWVVYDAHRNKGIVAKVEKVIQVENEVEVMARCVVTGKCAIVPCGMVYTSIDSVPEGDKE